MNERILKWFQPELVVCHYGGTAVCLGERNKRTESECIKCFHHPVSPLPLPADLTGLFSVCPPYDSRPSHYFLCKRRRVRQREREQIERERKRVSVAGVF